MLTWAEEKLANREARMLRRVQRRFGTFHPPENPEYLPGAAHIALSDLRPRGTLLSCKCGATEAVSERGTQYERWAAHIKRFAERHAECAEK